MRFAERTRLARMSDGHYCLVRDLGLVKGGRGLKHHEIVVAFTMRGVLKATLGFIRKRLPSRSRSVEASSGA
jgi:hypothetical protein